MNRPYFSVTEATMSLGNQLATIRYTCEYRRGPDGKLTTDERGMLVPLFYGYAASIQRAVGAKSRKVVMRRRLADLRRAVERDMLRHAGAAKP